jgi:hypothetical protein
MLEVGGSACLVEAGRKGKSSAEAEPGCFCLVEAARRMTGLTLRFLALVHLLNGRKMVAIMDPIFYFRSYQFLISKPSFWTSGPALTWVHLILTGEWVFFRASQITISICRESRVAFLNATRPCSHFVVYRHPESFSFFLLSFISFLQSCRAESRDMVSLQANVLKQLV